MLGEGGEGSVVDLANYDQEAPVLHVLVVGFHHKKGCQVILNIKRSSMLSLISSKCFFFRLNSHTHHLFPGGTPYLHRLDISKEKVNFIWCWISRCPLNGAICPPWPYLMAAIIGQMTLSTFTCLPCMTLGRQSLESLAIDRWVSKLINSISFVV